MPSHPPQKLAQPLTPPGLPQAQAWGPGQLRLCRLGGSPPPRIVSWVHDSPSWEGPRGPGGIGLLIWVCFRFEPPRTQGAQLGVPLHPQEASPKVLGGQLPIRCSRKPPGGSLCAQATGHHVQGAGCLLCLGSQLGQSWGGGCPVPMQAWIDAFFLRVLLRLYPLKGNGWGAVLAKFVPRSSLLPDTQSHVIWKFI